MSGICRREEAKLQVLKKKMFTFMQQIWVNLSAGNTVSKLK